MRKNYLQLTNAVRSQLNPEGMVLEKAFTDEIGSLSYSDVLVFIRTAMNGVDPEYTRRSMEAGEKVKEHLRSVLVDVTYEYQGSVMTDTHIRGYSDIDLLTIAGGFYSWDSGGVKQILENHDRRKAFSTAEISKLEYEDNLSSYAGNSLSDLQGIRLTSEKKMQETYIECDVSSPKAIKIKNRNLNREVDIVVANWYDDVTSIINNKGEYRGIQVYNKHEHKKGPANYPFLSIARINEKSALTYGRLKKMIRFLKNCKGASQSNIQLSSFDINAICYDIDISKYKTSPFQYLVIGLYMQLKKISEDTAYADRLLSVDGREFIFRFNSEKKQSLRQLLVEVESVYLDLLENRLIQV